MAPSTLTPDVSDCGVAPTSASAVLPLSRSSGDRWLGSLSLVNLAGSGRRYHCSDCSPVEEGRHVHGLASLSLVVGQLSEGKSRYISYRDSPTTELLQEALGGRGRSAWLTHLIPGSDILDYDENVNSLHSRSACV